MSWPTTRLSPRPELGDVKSSSRIAHGGFIAEGHSSREQAHPEGRQRSEPFFVKPPSDQVLRATSGKGFVRLDEIVSGGFTTQRTYLVEGGPRTGKTTLGRSIEGVEISELIPSEASIADADNGLSKASEGRHAGTVVTEPPR